MIYFLLKQSYYHLYQLIGIKDIKKVIKDLEKKEGNEELIKKLKLILEVREFAQNKIFLNLGKNYSKVNLNWNRKIVGITGCKPLSFTPYVWKFPIVGNMYLKGFYDKKDAEKEKKKLISKGYEVDVGNILAYSTLGYLQDPILGNMLNGKYPDINLIDLIIHESVHATLYFKSKSIFNESLAEFIAFKATQELIETKKFNDYDKKEIIKKYKQHKENTENFKKEMNNLYQKLNTIYQSNKSKEEKKKAKEILLKKYQKNYFGINNAYLYSFKVYNNDTQYFEKILNYCQNIDKENKWKLFLNQMKKMNKKQMSLEKIIDELK